MNIIHVAEIEAESFFANESVNWRYCVEHAVFQHKDACEFMIYLHPCDEILFLKLQDELQRYGCTADFLAVIKEARDKEAVWALFHA